MKDESISNFGLLIAYILPGCVALWGLGQLSPPIGAWLESTSSVSPSLGGFLYVTLAAVGAGLTASTFRWLLIDPFHHKTGVKPPKWNFSRISEHVDAYAILIDSHYRYYQFYANTLVSAAFAYFAWILNSAETTIPGALGHVAFCVISPAFFAGSRDTLRKYYSRVETLKK